MSGKETKKWGMSGQRKPTPSSRRIQDNDQKARAGEFQRASIVVVDDDGTKYGVRWDDGTLRAEREAKPGALWVHRGDRKLVIATDQGKGTIVWRLTKDQGEAEHYKPLTTSATRVGDVVQLDETPANKGAAGGQWKLEATAQDGAGEGSNSRFGLALDLDSTPTSKPSANNSFDLVLAPTTAAYRDHPRYRPVTADVREIERDPAFAARVDAYRDYTNNFCPDWAAIVMIVLLVIVIILVVVFAAVSTTTPPERQVVFIRRPPPRRLGRVPLSWSSRPPPYPGSLDL